MKIKKNIKTNKLLFKLIIITSIFILFGILYISILSKNSKLLIKDNLNTFFNSINKLNYTDAFINCLTSNIIIIILIWIFGISIIGVPLIILILIIKSFILGFSISSIIYFYKIKGILIAIIYLIPLIINLLIIIILGYYGIIFSKNLNQFLFLKKEMNFKNLMKKYLKLLLFSILCILISSFVEIYIIPNILKLLQI